MGIETGDKAMKALKLFVAIIVLLWALPAFAQIDPEMLKKAESGDAEAQWSLGHSSQDYTKLVEQFQEQYRLKQAEQGSAGFAQIDPKDDPEWSEIMKKAESGNVMSQWMVAVQYYGQGNESKSAYWAEKAAEQGFLPAQYDIGVAYLYGKGVPKDLTKAAHWFQKAAEQGESSAQHNLGKMYAEGLGVKQDYFKAVQWYQKAAEQGDAYAQYALGGMYFIGQGVIRDRQKGCVLLRTSAEQGMQAAIEFYNEYCAD
jgi:TPR repeat protein